MGHFTIIDNDIEVLKEKVERLKNVMQVVA
jgi:hypothetical protein